MVECPQIGVGGKHSMAYYEGETCVYCGAKDNRCHICKRLLDQDDDPFSLDCGGDCASCMIRVEAGMGQAGLEGALQLANLVTERIKAQLEALASEDVNEVEGSEQPANDA